MPDPVATWLADPQVRRHLLLFARTLVDPRWCPKFDASDLVQQTLLECQRDAQQFHGHDRPAFEAWLRRILVNNLANQIRHWTADKRDVRLERSIGAAIAASSARLEALLTASTAAPDHQAQQKELFDRLAQAMESLPDDQRNALVCRYFHDFPVAEIAQQLARTSQSVAGLLHRGLEHLRRRLDTH